jgi:hypothetical protein
MGTSLTGTTPQDTYDALIKVGDNGIITGSLKTLSDGFGNDTALALSDSAASVTGTLAVSGNATFDTNTLFVDASNNRVGVGTATPSVALDVVGKFRVTDDIILAQTNGRIDYDNGITGALRFYSTSTAAERMRITSAGVLELAQGQIKFPAMQVPSADPNTLDDYEEGTWTPSISFGGASVGVTLNAANAASYTKIGRQVTVNGYLILTSKGSSTGTARLTGLPFTVANTNGTYSAATLRFQGITFTNQFQGFANVNTTTVEFEEITLLGAVTNITNADFANDSQIIFSLTYFV